MLESETKYCSKSHNPFGSLMQGRLFSVGGVYRYSWNGKESESELFEGCLTFEARIFDSRIARWMSTDPREAEYAWQSTYVYFANSPILQIDILGMGGPYQEDQSYNESNSEGNSSSKPKHGLRGKLNSVVFKIKLTIYTKHYNAMKQKNPITDNENIKQYETRIATQMLEQYGSKHWMWHKTRHSTDPSNTLSNGTGQNNYIWVGGFAIPEATDPNQRQTISLQLGMITFGGSGVFAFNLLNAPNLPMNTNIQVNLQNTGTGNMTITNISITNNNGSSNQVLANQPLPGGGSLNAGITTNPQSRMLYINFSTDGTTNAVPVPSFTFQRPILTYPVTVAYPHVPSERKKAIRLYNNTGLQARLNSGLWN